MSCTQDSCSNTSCGQGGCFSGCGCGSGGDCPITDLLMMTKFAKRKILMEKIKVKLEAKIGKKLDAVADLAVEALLAKQDMADKKEEAMHAWSQKFEAIWSE